MFTTSILLWGILSQPMSESHRNEYARDLRHAADEIEAATRVYFPANLGSDRSLEIVERAERREDRRFKASLTLAGATGLSAVTYVISGTASPHDPSSGNILVGLFSVAIISFMDAARIDAFTASIPTRRRMTEDLMRNKIRARVDPIQIQLKSLREWMRLPPHLYSDKELKEKLESLYFSLLTFGDYAHAEFLKLHSETRRGRYGEMQRHLLVLAYRESMIALADELVMTFRDLAQTLDTPEWDAMIHGSCPVSLTKIRLTK